MTLKEVRDMVAEIGPPSAYHHFRENTEQATPYICYMYDGDNDMMADNSNYVGINTLVIELYTDYRDFALEKTLEGVLRDHGFAWSRGDDYVDSEKLYITVYTMEVVINGEE